MAQISEQDLLEQHIICPKTKDIRTLKYLQDLGYTLYFLDKDKYVCRLFIVYNKSCDLWLYQAMMKRTAVFDLSEFDFVTESNYRIRENLSDNMFVIALFKEIWDYTLFVEHECD